MKISIRKASLEEKNIIENLSRFYLYDMSRYCGAPLDWKVPPDGLYESLNVNIYWEEENRFPMLVFVDEELAGFVLVHDKGSVSEIDWVIGEFYIVPKYQGRGLGTLVAKRIFEHFTGIWEVMQIPQNVAAIKFWEKVIHKYTGGKFLTSEKMIPEPTPHPMKVMNFSSEKKD